MRFGLTIAVVILTQLAGVAPVSAEWPDVRPPTFTGERTTRHLPGQATAVSVAASGRLLIYRLEALRVLAVFDVADLKVTGYIPLPESDDLVAAGRDVLFVADTDSGRIQRWSLQTLEQEYDGTLKQPAPITSIGIGSSAAGPLFVVSQQLNQRVQDGDVAVLDPETLTPLNVALESEWKTPQERPAWSGGNLVVSDDGRTFVVGKSHLLGQLQESGLWLHRFRCEEYHTPGSNGRFCFGRPTPLSIKPDRYSDPHELSRRSIESRDPYGVSRTVNGTNSPFYLQIIDGPSDPERGTRTTGGVAVAGSRESLRRFELFPHRFSSDGSSIPTAERVSFIPDAGVVVCVTTLDRELEIVKVDMHSVAEQSEYLVVTSPTNLWVTPGDDLTSQIDVVSGFDTRRFMLDYGPEGMTLSSTGELHWKVPPKLDAAVDAVVHVTGGDREHYHCMQFSMSGAASSPAPASGGAAKVQDPEAIVPGGGRYSVMAPTQVERAPFEGARLRRSLPAATDLVAVGGGGRFLVLHLLSLNKLALFDVNQAAIVGYIPTTGTDSLFAAGADCVITGEITSRTLRRWDLGTLRQPMTTVFETEGYLSGMLMGCASTDSVIVGTAQHGAEALNAKSLKPLPEPFDRSLQFYDSINDRVSADGRLLQMAATYQDGGGAGHFELTLFEKNGSRWEARYVPRNRDLVFPIADGSFVVESGGIYSVQIGQFVNRTPPRTYMLGPAVRGNLYLTLGESRMYVNVAGVSPPYVTITDPPDFSVLLNAPQSRAKPLDQRIWFIPDADVLITLSPERDELTLHRLDIEQTLADGGDFLVVREPPIVTARTGENYEYAIAARTQSGGITYEVKSGPEGMQVSTDGAISWNVPGDWKSPKQDVVVTLRNERGLEIQHPWTIWFPELLQPQKQ